MNKVAVIQSNYIPWKGYFDIIHDVDQFIFYDDVQYTKNDWRNRNKIKTIHGAQWITIPIGAHNDQLIYEVEINDLHWSKKHWETIKQSYSKTPYFCIYKDFFDFVFVRAAWKNLSEFNQFLIKHISKEYLGIQTQFLDSREFHPQGGRIDRLVDLLKKAGADYYVSGPTARAYINEEIFWEAGIELHFKDYSGYPEYPQLFPPFEHAVSILDVLFNCGPDAPYYIWGWREVKPAEQLILPDQARVVHEKKDIVQNSI
jgi:hypothetical protein